MSIVHFFVPVFFHIISFHNFSFNQCIHVVPGGEKMFIVFELKVENCTKLVLGNI